jgi:hypothetical protein
MLVVCRAVFLIAALGFGAAALPDSLHLNTPESYPAAPLVAVDTASAEYKSVDAMFDELDVVKPTLVLKTGPTVGGVIEAVPLKPRLWWKVETHPLLEKAIPGVEFYVVLGDQGREWGSASDWLMASSHGQLYHLPEELNQLLCDNGMSFTGADVQTCARLACVVWASRYRQELWDDNWRAAGAKPAERRDYWDLPAIPPVTFQEVQVDTGEAETVAVRVVIDARPFHLTLAASRMELGSGTSKHIGIVPWWVGSTIPRHPLLLRAPKGQSRLEGGPKLDQRDH